MAIWVSISKKYISVMENTPKSWKFPSKRKQISKAPNAWSMSSSTKMPQD